MTRTHYPPRLVPFGAVAVYRCAVLWLYRPDPSFDVRALAWRAP
jgi:hypothetical protein